MITTLKINTLRKYDVLPKVEGIASIPKDQKKPANPLYRTSNGSYGAVSKDKHLKQFKQIRFVESFRFLDSYEQI